MEMPFYELFCVLSEVILMIWDCYVANPIYSPLEKALIIKYSVGGSFHPISMEWIVKTL